MADDEEWDDEEDDGFPPVLDDDDEDLEPEPEPEPPAIAEAVGKLCTDAELATTMAVLEKLQDQKEVFLDSKRFKKVRYYARQLNTTLNEKMCADSGRTHLP